MTTLIIRKVQDGGASSTSFTELFAPQLVDMYLNRISKNGKEILTPELGSNQSSPASMKPDPDSDYCLFFQQAVAKEIVSNPVLFAGIQECGLFTERVTMYLNYWGERDNYMVCLPTDSGKGDNNVNRFFIERSLAGKNPEVGATVTPLNLLPDTELATSLSAKNRDELIRYATILHEGLWHKEHDEASPGLPGNITISEESLINYIKVSYMLLPKSQFQLYSYLGYGSDNPRLYEIDVVKTVTVDIEHEIPIVRNSEGVVDVQRIRNGFDARYGRMSIQYRIAGNLCDELQEAQELDQHHREDAARMLEEAERIATQHGKELLAAEAEEKGEMTDPPPVLDAGTDSGTDAGADAGTDTGSSSEEDHPEITELENGYADYFTRDGVPSLYMRQLPADLEDIKTYTLPAIITACFGIPGCLGVKGSAVHALLMGIIGDEGPPRIFDDIDVIFNPKVISDDGIREASGILATILGSMNNRFTVNPHYIPGKSHMEVMLDNRLLVDIECLDESNKRERVAIIGGNRIHIHGDFREYQIMITLLPDSSSGWTRVGKKPQRIIWQDIPGRLVLEDESGIMSSQEMPIEMNRTLLSRIATIDSPLIRNIRERTLTSNFPPGLLDPVAIPTTQVYIADIKRGTLVLFSYPVGTGGDQLCKLSAGLCSRVVKKDVNNTIMRSDGSPLVVTEFMRHMATAYGQFTEMKMDQGPPTSITINASPDLRGQLVLVPNTGETVDGVPWSDSMEVLDHQMVVRLPTTLHDGAFSTRVDIALIQLEKTVRSLIAG